jgi:hypothetical protein
VSGTFSGSPWAPQGVFQSELRHRTRCPFLRAIRPAALDGRADTLDLFLGLQGVQPLQIVLRLGNRAKKRYLTPFSPEIKFTASSAVVINKIREIPWPVYP